MEEEGKTNFHSKDVSCGSSGEFFEEKSSAYFSTMNPLAARIYQDINKVTDKCEIFSSLSYDEKCSLIDKHLISVDEDQGRRYVSHTAAMLLSVYPKKAVEDNSSFVSGRRNDSVRFTSCTESQIDGCNLGKLLKRVTLLTQKKQKQRASMNKKTKAPAPKPNNMVSKSSTESFADEIQVKNHIDVTEEFETTTWNVEKTNQEILHSTNYKKNEVSKFLTKADMHNDEDSAEDRLPQQKQNSDLIAELQAKLKRNRGGDDGHGQICSGNSPILLKHHILKPKAPPPPPPTQKKATVENGKSGEIDNSKQVSEQDTFVVDVSSPCRIATPKTGFDFLDNW